MEDDKKKKKKSKKKKNKQAEATNENVPVSGDGQASQPAAGDVNSDDASAARNGKVTEAVVDVRSDDLQDGDVTWNGHESNGTETSKSTLLAESEEKNWLQKEAAYEQTIKQLQMEKDVYIQKEATLEDAIKRLQNGNDSQLQKQVTLEDTINRLRNENDSLMQKEATLEDTLKQLQEEKDSHIKKEAGIQMELVQLQNEKVSWLQTEAGLEEKIGRLVDENGTLSSQEACLQEKVKHLEKDRDTWVLKEGSFKEMVNDDITRLRAQVLELEQSRKNLDQENQQLMEKLSSLQFQIKNLESVSSTRLSDELAKHASEREALSSQVEEAYALVEKLATENAELIEKVSELYVELDGKSATVLPPETASVLNPVSRSNEDETISDQKLDSLEVVPLAEEVHSNGIMDSQHAASVPDLPVSDEISEIVQIPLDENEEQNVELQSTENDEHAAVPITDAPLIGAPFRFMSFVARYVSGADLVNEDTRKL